MYCYYERPRHAPIGHARARQPILIYNLSVIGPIRSNFIITPPSVQSQTLNREKRVNFMLLVAN